jgi:hypothetical protein
MKPWRDKMLLTALSCIPARLASHALFLLRNNPAIPDRLGYHVRPIHYYEPLPDFREISRKNLLTKRVSPAIDFRVPDQLSLLRQFACLYRSEIEQLAKGTADQRFDFSNDYFAGFDAAIYYSMIRSRKPRQIVEIGSGFSTQIAARALRRNADEGHVGELTCIEPFPQDRLTAQGLNFNHIAKKVQDVDLSLFSTLGEDDILFIDSSHAVTCGSDVCYEFLQILPILQPGVNVHVHDIFFPHDYPPEWVLHKRIAFSEQYILEAFLQFNSQYRVEMSNYWVSLEFPDVVKELCPSDAVPSIELGRSSFWMRRL